MKTGDKTSMSISIKTGLVVLLLPFIFFLTTGTVHSKAVKPSLVKSVRIMLPENSTEIMGNIASIFASRIEERSGASVSTNGDAQLTVELEIKPGIGKEAFKITDGKNGRIRIIGNDPRGVLYGVGKFLRTSAYGKDGFTAGEWRGTSVPEKATRGIYFATHFYNYYQNAPVDEVERYIEDLALWGINSLMFWFDMHHFNGVNDPEAKDLNSRLKRFAACAKRIGLETGFIMIGNEGYANSPVELRAVPGGSRGGNYPEVICPNKPGGMDYILQVRNDFFKWAQEIQPDYICIWPYDQGGCGCADCKPWGSNGFIKCAKAVSELAKKKLPGTKVMLSTWYFDSTEWAGLSEQLATDHSWVDMIMAEDIDINGYKLSYLPPLAGNLPTVGFPEISMYNTFPWGGFGATPLPNHLAGQWERMRDRLSGGFPYSEGIFDDMSKVVYAQWYWDPDLSADEILREYIAYEYSPDVVGEILKVIAILEQNHHMRWWPGKLEGVKLMLDWFPSKGVMPQADPGAEEAYAVVKQVDHKLPEWAQKSWRWRILFIRAMLDAELKANGGTPNQACMNGFQELMKIYHTSEKTDPVVKPPVPLNAKPVPDATIDFAKPAGKIKPLHGVNGGPFKYGDHQAPLDLYHAEAGFPHTRLHDANWPHPDAVDIHTIFPIFDLNPDDPKNYYFEKTDDYIAPIIKNKSEVIFRLGVSIEHVTHYHNHPPKDYAKWAKICTNIIRHYNDGWANGFHYNIKYWEIWNENSLERMWSGTAGDYFRLYETAAKAIKKYNPALKVGGPAAAGVQPEHNIQIKPFLEYCRDHSVPLDFFSWHRYSSIPEDLITDARLARTLLDNYGFKNTENHLNEWHFIQSWSVLGTTLGTRDTVDYSTVEAAFAKTVGPEGAVFSASALMLFQDAPVDVANFYCADYSPWSMFDAFGVRSKVFYVFKAFNQIAKMTDRVDEWHLPNDSVTLLAAATPGNNEGAFLLSSSAKQKKTYQIDIRNFPGKGKIHIQIYQIDKDKDLERIKAYDSELVNPVLNLDLPPLSVSLVKLCRIP